MPSTIAKTEVLTGLNVEVSPSLFPITVNHWRQLFADHPDPPELIQLVDRAGMDGFKYYSIVVRDGAKPILVLPLMQARYPIATTLDGKARQWAMKLESWLPDVIRPKVLVVGFVEGEWGQIGVSSAAPAGQIDQAWSLAFAALESLSRKLAVEVIAFWQFTGHTLGMIPEAYLDGYSAIAGQPFAHLEIPYKTLDEYLAVLDKDMRRYLTRVKRNADAVKIVRTTSSDPWIEQIYALYKAHVEGSEMSFGLQSREYFARACLFVPGAEYLLYLVDSRLVGFELVLVSQSRLVSKYFAMDAQAGRAHKLYFLSWLENLRYCLERGIPAMHVGAAGEGLKSKLGARLMPTAVILKHRNPLINLVLNKISDSLAYESEVDLPRVSLTKLAAGSRISNA